MFDEQPDGDPHGECAAEIHRLQAEIERLSRELELEKEHTSKYVAQFEHERLRAVVQHIADVPDHLAPPRSQGWIIRDFARRHLRAREQAKPCNEVPPGNGYCDMCAAGHYESCRYVARGAVLREDVP